MPLLLHAGLPVHVHGTPPTGSPCIMEPGCGADSRVWSGCLLMTTPSTSVAGMPGYVAPPPGITPPDFSSWSLPPPEVPPSPGTTCSLPGPLSHWEVHTSQGHDRKTGLGAARTVSKGSGPTCSDTAPSGTTHPSGGAASPSATTWAAGYSVPAGGTATW